MIEYLKLSVSKFKNEVGSKAIYEMGRWLVGLGILLITSAISLGYLNGTYIVPLYFILFYSLILILITWIGVEFRCKRKYRKIHNTYLIDELTGLPNYKALKEYLSEKIVELERRKEGVVIFSLIIIDIDNFKEFNSKNGDNIADQILVKVGELLDSDKRITDKLFRYHLRGDEFLYVLDATSAVDARTAAERKRGYIQDNSFYIGDQQFGLTVCCGITEFKKNDDYTSLTSRVYSALMDAKEQPEKNCIRSRS